MAETLAADVVVIGGGHNGLVAAAYIAATGVDTILVEARDSVGGCASTVDAIGGRVNVCNCDHLWVRGTPIVEELDLEAHGLSYLDLDPCYASLGWAGETPWLLYHDVERTLDGLSTTHPRQVESYRRHVAAMLPVARLVRDVTNALPTPGRVARRAASHPSAALRLLRASRQSAVGALAKYFDDEEMIRPALTAGPVVWGVDPSWPGTGLAAAGYAAKHLIPVGRPRGGSGAFTDALHRAFTAAGGRTLLAAAVTRVETSAGDVSGVVLGDGRRITSSRVLATTDPAMVFGRWLAQTAPASATEDAEGPEGYESKIDAFVREPPRYRDLGTHDPDGQHATVLVSPPVREMSEAHAALASGRIAERPMLITNTPSTLDPSLRDADGNHLLSLEVLWTPFSASGSWRSSPEPARWLDSWARLIEQPLDDLLVRHRVMTPDRYETEFHMRKGHAPSFAGSPLAAVRGKPRHLTRYRTDVAGLYLGGAATYPGAGIWGAPGRNAASVVLADLGAVRR